MFRVLVIDDDACLYSLLEEYFNQTEFRSDHAGDAETGLSMLMSEPNRWDIVVLDVMLPGMNGFTVLRRLREHPLTRKLPILMLTAVGGEDERVAGLEAGADDYLVKPFILRELSARLLAILRRIGAADKPAAPVVETVRIDNLSIDRAALQAECDGAVIRLSHLEVRLLDVLTETPGAVVSREELFRQVFEHEANNYDRSLDMAISRLRKKLGPRSDGGERIRAVWGQGYVFLLPGADS